MRECSLNGCNRQGKIKRKLCHTHYERWRAHGDSFDKTPIYDESNPRPFVKCSIEGCNRQHKSLSWCALHYGRWQKYKDLNRCRPKVIKRIPIEIRFWKYVIKSDDPNGCWEWIGSKNQLGYGMIRMPGEKSNRMAHRLSYEMVHGKFPPHLHCCHSCDFSSCVNPGHIWLGTDKDNSDDMMRKGRRHSSAGVKNPAAKLKDSDIIEIKRRLKNGEFQECIAKDFNVQQGTISRIKLGKTWNHVSLT